MSIYERKQMKKRGRMRKLGKFTRIKPSSRKRKPTPAPTSMPTEVVETRPRLTLPLPTTAWIAGTVQDDDV
jgi:hypothetical protein